MLEFRLDQGHLVMHDATGALAVFHPYPIDRDLSMSPIVFDLPALTLRGVNGTATSRAVMINIPDAAVDFGDSIGLGPGVLELHLNTDPINLVPVPEPGSIALFAIALVWLALHRGCRRRNSTFSAAVL